ncbi:superoxide dismutase [Xanthomonas cucurbitae]|uniref:Superoxide dismutase n=1 Tax=Xanthomonas cucurbitae TaxID=56453 RepID=A0A2S7DTJ9_9XANT|nr:superoxide dismutase [Xanthomonas cucurbitae]PPU77101.1 superoxide dismutase [Xanthomonas cucurbitae]WDM79484.1 superoxide dismutase [Xanthomonas cucurbitae]WDM83172.1 superoxide dismutase [Xanthomonas cucurbitae]
MNYRSLKTLGLSALLTFAGNVSASEAATAPFSLPALPYATNALEPAIDAETMEIHHARHHKAYVDNLNAKVKDYPVLSDTSLEDIQAHISRYDAAVRNNAGGHYNHSLFWTLMAPIGQGGTASPALKARLVQSFGSEAAFQARFSEVATKLFGSGWAWLILKPDGALAITTTPNQDNPLMDVVSERGTPLLALDVWEHAYYLHYQNKRADYIKAWWPLVNWNQVNARLEAATTQP